MKTYLGRNVECPMLTIQVTDDNRHLLNQLSKKGKATIHFQTAKIEMGKDEYGPQDVVGTLRLKITSIDTENAAEKRGRQNSDDSLEEFMSQNKE